MSITADKKNPAHVLLFVNHIIRNVIDVDEKNDSTAERNANAKTQFEQYAVDLTQFIAHGSSNGAEVLAKSKEIFAAFVCLAQNGFEHAKRIKAKGYFVFWNILLHDANAHTITTTTTTLESRKDRCRRNKPPTVHTNKEPQRTTRARIKTHPALEVPPVVPAVDAIGPILALAAAPPVVAALVTAPVPDPAPAPVIIATVEPSNYKPKVVRELSGRDIDALARNLAKRSHAEQNEIYMTLLKTTRENLNKATNTIQFNLAFWHSLADRFQS